MAHNLSPATRKASTRSSSAAGTTRPANASSSRQRDVRTISPTPSFTFGYNITYAIFYLGYSLLSWPISWTKFSKVSLPNAAIMHSNWLKVGSHVTWNIKSDFFISAKCSVYTVYIVLKLHTIDIHCILLTLCLIRSYLIEDSTAVLGFPKLVWVEAMTRQFLRAEISGWNRLNRWDAGTWNSKARSKKWSKARRPRFVRSRVTRCCNKSSPIFPKCIHTSLFHV